jgi:quercetin dioxygenase-like cupin family protein
MTFDADRAKAVEVILPCSDLTAALDFYTNELGFQMDVIYPADAPRVVEISAYGVRARLEHDSGPGENKWGRGRAGMQYRDLIPGRLGGRYIASNIRIQVGGPVPDYVHHHHVDFQMIYCYKGWVKVVYEDQGLPFVLEAGDCVLQPPHIRHRVLECSDNLEVIEVSSPAEHETLVEHDMELPTDNVRRDHDFSGQRFVRHEQSKADWLPGPYNGFEARDTGIGKATDGLATVQVIRPSAAARATLLNNDGDLFFVFILQGSTAMQPQDEDSQALQTGDAFVIPKGEQVTLTEYSKDLELLQVQTRRDHWAHSGRS